MKCGINMHTHTAYLAKEDNLIFNVKTNTTALTKGRAME